jgi:replicative DNA helicase
LFDEEVFIYALTSRPEDARRFAQMFKPQWLNKSEFAPILAEIYAFTKKNGEPPSCVTLHKIFEDKDPEAYKLRYKEAIEEVQKTEPDRSEMMYCLDQAKGVAVSRSFDEMARDQAFLKNQLDFNGTNIIRDVQSWISTFANSGEDKTKDLRKAIDDLIQTSEFTPTNIRIPTNIRPLDDWTGGGLRTKQLSIIIAPTGAGKSALLLVIAHKIAMIEQKNVWFITNELPLEEVTERELSKLTGVEVEKIMNDPIIAYKGLQRYWEGGLDKRFHITEYNREVSTDDMESELGKMSNLYGWKPDVIVLDYMERMKPASSGHRRDSEWVWMGAVAKDLSRLAKRHGILIWTAAQTNRGGLTAEDIDMSMAQSSIRHLQEATVVVAMNQIEIPNSDKVALKLKPLKMRQSKRSPRAVTLECNLSKMDISNLEVDPEDLKDDQEDQDYTAITPRQRQKNKKRN